MTVAHSIFIKQIGGCRSGAHITNQRIKSGLLGDYTLHNISS